MIFRKIAISLLIVFSTSIPVYADSGKKVVSIDEIREIVISHNTELKISQNNYKSKKQYYDDIDDDIDEYESKIEKIKDDVDSVDLLENYKDKLSELKKIEDKKDNDLKIARLTYENEIETIVAEAEQKYIEYINYVDNRRIKEEEKKYNEKSNDIQKLKFDMGRISKNEYNKNLIDTSDLDLELFKLKKDESLSYSQLIKYLGISNKNLEINEDIGFDLTKITKINFDNDFDQMTENNKQIKIKKINEDQIDDDDDANEYDEDNAALSVENQKEQIKLEFQGKYNDLINAYNSLQNENNKLINQQNLYNAAIIKYKNGSLSKKEYENERIILLKERQEYISRKNTLYTCYIQYIEMKDGYMIEGGVSSEND